MDDKKASPFIDPNLTQDDIPDEDLHTLARLAGEAVRRENAVLRARGILPPLKPADGESQRPVDGRDDDSPGR